MPEGLSVRAFAKALGVSHVAVLKAIERGRLRASIRINERGNTEIFDVDLAKREWADNAGKPTKPSAPVPSPGAPVTPVTPPVTTASSPASTVGEPIEASSLAEAQRLAALELARQRRLANQMREQQLLPAAAVKKLQFEAERVLRENLLNLPARISGQLAAESDVSRVYLLLDSAIREALQLTGARYRQEAAQAAASEASEVVHG